ncbi:MAG TPA: DUF4124 domain-containing protein [Gammaproteobacteria bacterium]|nr:DUF4124 domain-containing protein [Gammaproteobacteria bacterium]
MLHRYFHPLLFLAALFATVSAASGSKLYKWTDAQGRVHYSDKIPPDAAAREREVKSSQGMTVERVEAAKSREQLEAERRQREQEEAQRRAEEEAARKQAHADRTLLLTFSSTREIERARDDRVAAIDGQMALTRSRIETLQSQLEKTRQQAATAERTGRRAPQDLHNRAGDIERQISEAETFIQTRERERAAIAERFEADLARYKELKAAQDR